MISRLFAAALTFMIAVVAAAPAEARHVYVAYVDDNRPIEYAQADVLAAIQRVLREWEAHNSVTGLVFHWRGVIPLSSAADDFNNIVIRWLPENYTSIRGHSCHWEADCSDSPPTPTNHIQLATYFFFGNRANNPRWFWGMQPDEDLISVLHHELAHLLRNTGDHPSNSVLNRPAGHTSRYLWNGDILNVDNGRYPGHYQALQIFSVDGSNGNTSLKRDYLPSHRVLSPASMSVGDGLANTGNFAIAYASTSLPGSSAGRGAIIFKRTDGVSNDFDRVYTATSGGVTIGTTYHRPCVAISASLQDYYLVWTSPVEDGNGARQIFAAESHGGDASSWTQPEVIPYAWTRSGVSCSIDRSSERLVVAYTGSSEEGIWITSRPSLTAGSGQWANPTQVPVLTGGFQPRNYGPPDISFDFFSTASGTLAWQESRDLRVHRTSVTFSGGTFVFGPDQIENTDASLLRSWPVVSAEGVPILGSSLFTLPSGAGYQDERRSLQSSTPFVSTDAYGVGPWYARRYTGGASNLLLNERVFLSTSNTGL